MRRKKVCVLGLGYIGLPTAALLAGQGYQVAGVDLNEHAVRTINRGEIHIVEPDLAAYVRSAVTAGKLQAYARPQPADIFIICVPTPLRAAEGSGTPRADTDSVFAAARAVAPLLKPGNLVILESTSPVGTTEQVAGVLRDAGVDIDSIHVAYCPERVLPGKIMTELVENDRVVGGLRPQDTVAVSAFYRSFVRGNVLETDAPTAEMCKLAENSYRDVNVAFANELSLICAKSGIDVWRLVQLANRHPRVNILQPGAGVGGHCIAVDPWFIVASDPDNSPLIRTAREVNNRKTEWVIEQIVAAATEASARKGRTAKIACLGLSFKPDVDDLRESPAVQVATALRRMKFEVLAVEPNIETHEDLALTSLDDALQQADVVAVLVKHAEFVQCASLGKLDSDKVLDFCGVRFDRSRPSRAANAP
jgi:UDP-N-acetyl-D-mannosaminuronic acid dehydrogenase